MKKLLCVVLSLLILCACSIINEKQPAESVSPVAEETNYQPPVDVKPEFAAVTDISSSVIANEPEFDESFAKETLMLQENELGEYVFSPYQLHITPEMKLHYSATWAKSGCEVYFGLLNSDNEVYAASAAGGTLRGILSMEHVPQDDYQLILYSSNNPEVQAVLHYQFE